VDTLNGSQSAVSHTKSNGVHAVTLFQTRQPAAGQRPERLQMHAIQPGQSLNNIRPIILAVNLNTERDKMTRHTTNEHEALRIASDLYFDVVMGNRHMSTLFASGIMSYYSCNGQTAMMAIKKVQSLRQKYQQ